MGEGQPFKSFKTKISNGVVIKKYSCNYFDILRLNFFIYLSTRD